ncbi:RidA family protein [Mycobacterium sp. DL592]|uniref:RidA family protein n=1 Tax=Mycobacterium sp. DL592 TaxID=2675524 RepID=UPI00352DDC66
MPVTLINPDGLPEVGLYQQVAVASGTRLVFIAGQVARTAEGAAVGVGDLAAQVEQCYRNLGTALAAAGATFDDVVKLTVYLVDWTPDKMEPFTHGQPGPSRPWALTRLPHH